MVKVANANQHLPRVRNGRVILPRLGGVPGTSSSSRKKLSKNGTSVSGKKKQRTSFFLPHLDYELQRKVNLIAKRYNIYVGINKKIKFSW
jgi:hypothetical protein